MWASSLRGYATSGVERFGVVREVLPAGRRVLLSEVVEIFERDVAPAANPDRDYLLCLGPKAPLTALVFAWSARFGSVRLLVWSAGAGWRPVRLCSAARLSGGPAPSSG